MKALFIVIGVIVIFGILFSSGGLAGAICIQGVGCVRLDGRRAEDRLPGSVSVSTGNP